MKTYSALDRTPSAPNNTNMSNQLSSRSNAQINNQGISSISSRFSPQQNTSSSSYNMSSLGATTNTTSSQNLPYSNQGRGMPTSGYNQASSHQPQYPYHQQQPQSSSMYQQQQPRSQQQFSPQQNVQSNLQQQQQVRAPYRPPTNSMSGGPSFPPTTQQPIMSPNQIQPVSMRPPLQQHANDQQQRGPQMQQQQRFDHNPTSQHPQSSPNYPRNLPMMALQQQKVKT